MKKITDQFKNRSWNNKLFYFLESVIILTIIFIGIYFFLYPNYEKLHTLNTNKIFLQLQWQSRRQHLLEQDKLLITIKKFNEQSNAKLNLYHQHIDKSQIIVNIVNAMKINHLQLIELTPKTNKNFLEFNQQSFILKANGFEPDLFNFIHALTQQTWAVDFINISFSIVKQKLLLQMQMDIYYV